jgi:aquaporin Z
VAAQFAGGVAGVLAVAAVLGMPVAAPSVNYALTLPGMAGLAIAFAAELAISFATMLTVLVVSNTARLARHTPLFVGALVATWITLEAPLSGMSMNPARSFASAVGSDDFSSLWLYFAAPLAGMLLAAEVFVRARGLRAVHCAKLHHQNAQRCIFRCGYHMRLGGAHVSLRRDHHRQRRGRRHAREPPRALGQEDPAARAR